MMNLCADVSISGISFRKCVIILVSPIPTGIRLIWLGDEQMGLLFQEQE